MRYKIEIKLSEYTKWIKTKMYKYNRFNKFKCKVLFVIAIVIILAVLAISLKYLYEYISRSDTLQCKNFFQKFTPYYLYWNLKIHTLLRVQFALCMKTIICLKYTYGVMSESTIVSWLDFCHDSCGCVSRKKRMLI